MANPLTKPNKNKKKRLTGDRVQSMEGSWISHIRKVGEQPGVSETLTQALPCRILSLPGLIRNGRCKTTKWGCCHSQRWPCGPCQAQAFSGWERGCEESWAGEGEGRMCRNHGGAEGLAEWEGQPARWKDMRHPLPKALRVESTRALPAHTCPALPCVRSQEPEPNTKKVQQSSYWWRNGANQGQADFRAVFGSWAAARHRALLHRSSCKPAAITSVCWAGGGRPSQPGLQWARALRKGGHSLWGKLLEFRRRNEAGCVTFRIIQSFKLYENKFKLLPNKRTFGISDWFITDM